MSLLKQFIKYQSLGNDFVVFDWLKKPALFVHAELSGPGFSQFVQNLCGRHLGVGADGVLIITNNAQAGHSEMIIYNADGTKAESCLNGLRCVAHHLAVTYQFTNPFGIRLGGRVIECAVNPTGELAGEVTMSIGGAIMLGEQQITTDAGEFTGAMVSVGNPHFFVFDEVSLDWLRAHGKQIESHPAFSFKTNVEFVWEHKMPKQADVERSFVMNVYERGCGITLARSSGAAALTGLLYAQKAIKIDEKIGIEMPGGMIVAWINADESINLQGPVRRVFTGVLAD